MNRCLTHFVALALFFGGVGQVRAVSIYNNAADFSPTNNPNGVWSYGKLAPGITPDASTFSLYLGHGNTSGVDFVGVNNNGIFDPPYVSHNRTKCNGRRNWVREIIADLTPHPTTCGSALGGSSQGSKLAPTL